MEDSSDSKEFERRKFLEQVRKRAEEAELKRLDEEERRIAPGRPSAPPPPSAPKEDLLLEQKISELLGRLSIALDRGKVERATEVLDELSKLSKNESELDEFRERIEALRAEQERARETENAEEENILDDEKRGRIVELLENAGKAYQYEQYDRGMEHIQAILSLDPENASAIDLRKRIEAAQRLSEQIKEEEAKRKAEEETLFASRRTETTPATPAHDGDAWGSVEGTPSEKEMFGPGEEDAQRGPSGPTLSQRIIEVVSGIHIPAGTILKILAGCVVVVAAYLVVEHIQNVVPLSKYSVLILPATTAPSDSGSDYVAAGFTMDLINGLSSVPELRIIGSTTSNSFKGSSESPLELARSVGANYVLQWSLSKSGDDAAIQVDFSDTASQQSLLSNHYQNSLRELPALRLEIARALLDRMGIHTGGEASELAKGPSTSVAAAYDAYLRGRWLLQQGDSTSLERALASFEMACQADSNFADAYSALAWTRICMYEDRVDTSRRLIGQALSSINHVDVLGSRSSEQLRVKGMIDQYNAAYAKAQQELELAVESAPSDVESQRRLSIVYVARNRPDDALKAAQRAVTDDPHNSESFTTLGMIQQWRGEFTDALSSYEKGMQFSSDAAEYASGHYSDLLVYTQQSDRALEILSNRVAQARQSYRDYYKLGRVCQLVGKPKEEWQRSLSRAEDLLEERLRSNPDDAIALTYQALVRTRLGEFKDATAAVNRALQVAGQAPEVLYNTARIYAVRRDKQLALDYLSKALDGWFSLREVLDMDFYSFRSEPDFLHAITRH